MHKAPQRRKGEKSFDDFSLGAFFIIISLSPINLINSIILIRRAQADLFTRSALLLQLRWSEMNWQKFITIYVRLWSFFFLSFQNQLPKCLKATTNHQNFPYFSSKLGTSNLGEASGYSCGESRKSYMTLTTTILTWEQTGGRSEGHICKERYRKFQLIRDSP